MTKKISVFLILFLIITMLMPGTKVFAGKDDPTGIGIKYNSDGSLTYGDAYTKNTDQANVWNEIFTQYKGLIAGITGLATLTMVVLFIMNFVKLAKAGDNPNERNKAISGLLWTGAGAAGLGAVTIFVSLATNLLKGTPTT